MRDKARLGNKVEFIQVVYSQRLSMPFVLRTFDETESQRDEGIK
jgi:hypothetical protein